MPKPLEYVQNAPELHGQYTLFIHFCDYEFPISFTIFYKNPFRGKIKKNATKCTAASIKVFFVQIRIIRNHILFLSHVLRIL